MQDKKAVQPQLAIPYRAFVRNPALWSLCFTHFCNNCEPARWSHDWGGDCMHDVA